MSLKNNITFICKSCVTNMASSSKTNASTYVDQVKLVDPASSHMLVLKIKPCMFKFIPLNGETANGSLNQL